MIDMPKPEFDQFVFKCKKCGFSDGLIQSLFNYRIVKDGKPTDHPFFFAKILTKDGLVQSVAVSFQCPNCGNKSGAILLSNCEGCPRCWEQNIEYNPSSPEEERTFTKVN